MPPRALLAPLDPRRYRPTPQRPVRAKARRLDPDSEIQPHSHPWAQVAIAVSGVARITAERGTYLVPAWRALWVPPGVEHVVSVVEASELRTLYLYQAPGCVGPDVPVALQEPWRRCRVVEVSPLLREVVLQMDTGMDGGPNPGAAVLERERLLGAIAQDELRRAASIKLGIDLPSDKRLRSLCEAVIDDPSRHATLEAWAQASGASARTVARLFRSELSTSFVQWRHQVLLARALILAARGQPMKLIAAELGYASASAFSAMVRRSVGTSPSRFFGTG